MNIIWWHPHSWRHLTSHLMKYEMFLSWKGLEFSHKNNRIVITLQVNYWYYLNAWLFPLSLSLSLPDKFFSQWADDRIISLECLLTPHGPLEIFVSWKVGDQKHTHTQTDMHTQKLRSEKNTPYHKEPTQVSIWWWTDLWNILRTGNFSYLISRYTVKKKHFHSEHLLRLLCNWSIFSKSFAGQRCYTLDYIQQYRIHGVQLSQPLQGIWVSAT